MISLQRFGEYLYLLVIRETGRLLKASFVESLVSVTAKKRSVVENENVEQMILFERARR